MKFLIFESGEIHIGALDLLKENGHIIYQDNSDQYNNSEIEAVFIRSYTRINLQFLNLYPGLKYVLRAGVGLENVDLEECEKRKIKVINSPGSNANAVAELVVCFIILLLRNIPQQIDLLHRKKWRDVKLLGTELSGKTIGLIGCGAIGSKLTAKLQPFGIKEILAYDIYLDVEELKKRRAVKCGLEEVMKKSDIISLHIPLNSETGNIINKTNITLCKKNAYIINTSRGGIINEEDLIYALKNKIIAGAALDVFENEPQIRKEFLSLPNVIATPHIGGFSNEANIAMSVETVKNFLKMISII